MNRTQDKNQILNDVVPRTQRIISMAQNGHDVGFYIGRSNKSNKSMNRTQDKNQIFN